MRITIDLSRKGGVPRIRTKWYTNSEDDFRMRNLGIEIYRQWCDLLDSIENRFGGKRVVVENLGEQN